MFNKYNLEYYFKCKIKYIHLILYAEFHAIVILKF